MATPLIFQTKLFVAVRTGDEFEVKQITSTEIYNYL